MVLACLTTEAVLQARLLPAQERRNGRFAKVTALRFIQALGFLNAFMLATGRSFHAYDYAAKSAAYAPAI